ncbi:hypothetical protein E8L99_16250 [Phreatobacter aquaticus]|uniref:Uncharacterized protein n=1 Tax=Phreatobacter aquaticus TaxID=2570229 RepID=A0A4D7QIF3_9HYPH|nr:hypothetical protein [Phreatobacter aquaticus]QCK87198.1 hypothetical protein E8L99_16250 [Phreatobacter aquaticus]
MPASRGAHLSIARMPDMIAKTIMINARSPARVHRLNPPSGLTAITAALTAKPDNFQQIWASFAPILMASPGDLPFYAR